MQRVMLFWGLPLVLTVTSWAGGNEDSTKGQRPPGLYLCRQAFQGGPYFGNVKDAFESFEEVAPEGFEDVDFSTVQVLTFDTADRMVFTQWRQAVDDILSATKLRQKQQGKRQGANGVTSAVGDAGSPLVNIAVLDEDGEVSLVLKLFSANYVVNVYRPAVRRGLIMIDIPVGACESPQLYRGLLPGFEKRNKLIHSIMLRVYPKLSGAGKDERE